MSKITKITAFFMFFVMCFCVKNISAQDLVGNCPYTHKWCCWNGKMTCVEKSSSAADYCTASCATLVDPDIGLDKPFIPILPGDSCGTAGTKQYKYTASGCTHTTETNTCCSNGSWSGFGKSCPTTKDCTGTKPATRQACFSGYQTRTVSCNTSTGNWTTGAWGTCDCTNSDYEWVTPSSGSRCCQHKSCGTSGNTGQYICCHTDLDKEVPWRWVEAGTVYCNGFGVGSLAQCGACTGNGQECRVVISSGLHLGMEEANSQCTVYSCRQG